MLNHLFAIDLGGGPTLLIVAVFVLTFLIVFAMASAVLFRKRAPPPAPQDRASDATASAAGETSPISNTAPIAKPDGAFDLRGVFEKVRGQMIRNQPLPTSMTDAQKARAVEMIRDGLPISEAARTVYPHFDELDEPSRQALESALQEMAKAR